MKKLDSHVNKKSIWNTIPPLAYAKSLPFYVIESGLFFAEAGYLIDRNYHDSYLLLYTLAGNGIVEANGAIHTLQENQCIMIDCHIPHKYYTSESKWDFIWIHINGLSCKYFFQTLYPNEIFTLSVKNPSTFEQKMRYFIDLTKEQSLSLALEQSLCIHELFNDLIQLALQKEQAMQKRPYDQDIKIILKYIEKNYDKQITIDDMLSQIHISKYHFIRIFKRTIGVTPYHYLNAYRINHGKMLLCTTTSSISEISEQCGFLDTSNFIYQFKKLTGLKPTEYRKKGI